MIRKNICSRKEPTGIWDLRLNAELMAKVRLAAFKSKKSMSWVVRYCVFRLARKKVVDREAMQNIAKALREKNQKNPTPSQKLCRLNVCLYADDERLFCELKYRFRLTTTMVVRIALVRYLDSLISGKVPYWRLFWYGIKFIASHEANYSTTPGFPVMDFHNKKFLKPEDYWNTPEGILPKYLLYTKNRL